MSGLAGGADDDPLGSAVEVRRRGRPIAEEAGALEHDFSAEVLPIEVGGVALRGDRDAPIADPQRTIFRSHRVREMPVNRVPFEQVRKHLGAREVVDPHQLDVALCPLGDDAGDASPDPSKPIDSDFGGHPIDSLCTPGEASPSPGERGT